MHAYRKQRSGSWEKDEVCGVDLAFGKKDAMYRTGCGSDNYVYIKKDKFTGWQKFGTNKAKATSASKNAVWIIENESHMPFKFDEESQQFIQKGN